MTTAGLGIGHERGGSLSSVAGTLQGLAEIRDRLLVAAFTAELTEKLSDRIAPRDIRGQSELEPLHDHKQVIRVARLRSLGGGRSVQGGTCNDERQETSQRGEASARHVRMPWSGCGGEDYSRKSR